MNKHTSKIFFGVRKKLLLLIFFISFFVFAVGTHGLITVNRLTTASEVVIKREIPLVRSIEEALTVMNEGRLAVEQAFDIVEPSQIAEVVALEAQFTMATERFNAFLSAITWGSESEAFKRTNQGKDFAVWRDLGLGDTFVVPQPSSLQVRLAGEAGLYYRVAVQHATEALIIHRTVLINPEESLSRELAKDEMRKSRYFAGLAIEKFKRMVEISSETIGVTSRGLEEESRKAFLNIILFSVVGLIVPLLAGMVFTDKVIISPLNSLLEAADRLGKGDLSYRASVNTKDEIATLAETFNSMASSLASHTASLEKEVVERTKKLEEHIAINKHQVEDLARLNKELNTGTTLLIRRDLELSRANERLKSLDEAKSEFVSVAAHQLRTPLSGVKWTMNMVLSGILGPLNTEQKSFLMKCYESNERMILLINDMLGADRVDSDKLKYHFVPTQISDLLDNVLFEMTSLIAKKKLQIAFVHKDRNLPQVNIDTEKMRAVLQNLLENTVKYTPDGGKIEMDFQVAGEFVQMSIKDSGIGIPEEDKKNIFKRFFRAKNAVKVETDGSGLGLFIAKGIVEKHGGKIWFESSLGQGTTFNFTIPISK